MFSIETAAGCNNRAILRVQRKVTTEIFMPSHDGDHQLTSRRQVIAGLTVGAAMVGAGRIQAGAPVRELVHNMDAIHQEVSFNAARSRVYAVLTDAHEFQRVVALSGAVASGKVKTSIPAQIGREAGAPLSIFGGFVVGRNIELIPDTRLVQAWRPQNWLPGVYSIVKFELVEHGAGTRLVFDQTGFPTDDAEQLVQGWKMNYWEPMAKVLAG
jgi:activator of HSP90 ATPase